MNFPPSSNYWHGRSIGDNQRYRIDKPLAVGGMGEVLLATDTRLGQQVVLKLLKDTLVASQEMRKRFEREVAVCAALQSDHYEVHLSPLIAGLGVGFLYLITPGSAVKNLTD